MEPGKRLLGKIAIVTGGASGIGAETARTFARHGASVVLCDLQDEMGLAVAGEALRYAKDLVRVNSVHPRVRRYPFGAARTIGKCERQGADGRYALGPFRQPSDIALGCLYLASDDAAWVTGSELVIDGDMTAN